MTPWLQLGVATSVLLVTFAQTRFDASNRFTERIDGKDGELQGLVDRTKDHGSTFNGVPRASLRQLFDACSEANKGRSCFTFRGSESRHNAQLLYNFAVHLMSDVRLEGTAKGQHAAHVVDAAKQLRGFFDDHTHMRRTVLATERRHEKAVKMQENIFTVYLGGERAVPNTHIAFPTSLHILHSAMLILALQQAREVILFRFPPRHGSLMPVQMRRALDVLDEADRHDAEIMDHELARLFARHYQKHETCRAKDKSMRADGKVCGKVYHDQPFRCEYCTFVHESDLLKTAK